MAAYLPEDKETLIAWLGQARKRYHELMMGESVRVFVDQNGERIEYTAGSAANLLAYIRQLEAKLSAGSGRSNGPIGFLF